MKRWIQAVAVLLLVCASLSARSAPPDDAALRALFVQIRLARLAVEAVDGIEKQREQSLQQQLAASSDANRQQRLRKRHEQAAALIREEMQWERLEPDAIAVYRRFLNAEQVQQLSAFYATPVGRLSVEKFAPAMIRAALDLHAEIDSSVDRLFEADEALVQAHRAKTELPPAASPAPLWQPGTEVEQLAVALIEAHRTESTDQQSERILASFGELIDGLVKPKAGEDGTFATLRRERFMAGMQAISRKDRLLKTIVERSLRELDEAELRQLLGRIREPEAFQLMRLEAQAEEALSRKLQERVSTEVLGKLLKLLGSES